MDFLIGYHIFQGKERKKHHQSQTIHQTTTHTISFER